MENVKIDRITARNIKAVESFTGIFGGKSAHISGKNGYGKSTVIRVLWDRLNKLRPATVTKTGTDEGFYQMELTDGARFRWTFNAEGGEKLIYITSEGVKAKDNVFKAIVSRYFSNTFDIDRFLKTTEARKRLKMISELVKVDLSEISDEYKSAFEERRDEKRDLKTLEAQLKDKPVYSGQNLTDFCKAEYKLIDLITAELKQIEATEATERERLNTLYAENKKANTEAETAYTDKKNKAVKDWQEKDKEEREKVDNFNNTQDLREKVLTEFDKEIQSVSELTRIIQYIDFDAIALHRESLPKPEPQKTHTPEIFPTFEPLNLPDAMPDQQKLDEIKTEKSDCQIRLDAAKDVLQVKEIEKTNLEADFRTYKKDLIAYKEQIEQYESKEAAVADCEETVAEILERIKSIVSSAKLPPEFKIDLTDKNDILFCANPEAENAEFFPITTETLASSAIYIAAFKLAVFNLDLFRVVHFDVSYLDYENREIVRKEAEKLDIQLFTESPAIDKDAKKELHYIITE